MKEDGLEVPKPLKENRGLDKLLSRFWNTFDFEIPKPYIDLLKVCDGLQENGCQIYGLNMNEDFEDIFQINKEYRSEDDYYLDFVVFAESDLSFFGYSKKLNTFIEMDWYDKKQIQSFSSFEKMIIFVLNLMHGDDTTEPEIVFTESREDEKEEYSPLITVLAYIIFALGVVAIIWFIVWLIRLIF